MQGMGSWKLTVALALLLFGYISFGGWIFCYCEQDHEAKDREEIRALYHNLVNNSINGCIDPNRLNEFLHRLTGGKDFDPNGNGTVATKWDYGGAVFFSFTVVSTIGYGVLAPATRAGRTAFILYGVFGIPMFITLLNAISDLSKAVHKRLREKHAKSHTAVCIVCYLSASLFLFFLPAAVVSYVEDWTYADSVYFAFQTLTTIGFGDMVPGLAIGGSFPRPYRCFIVIWVIVGLAYVTALMSFLNELNTKFLRALGRWREERKIARLANRQRISIVQEISITKLNGAQVQKG